MKGKIPETAQAPPLVRINQIQNNDTKKGRFNPQKVVKYDKKGITKNTHFVI
jgi:hypothetical protein